MRVFIAGSKGQLGAEFVRLFEGNGWEYAAADLDTLDIADGDAVLKAVMPYRPGLIINCAAYNLVDKAEAEPAAAAAVNAGGVRNLAFAARQLESKLLHFGTDYVFDGEKRVPYVETDAVNPLNEYGRSKLKGEEYALDCPGSLVLRLSWVYGRGTQNFMHKLLGWAEKPGPLRVADDEVSVPTRASDAVAAVMEALKAGLTGRWHLSGGEPCSRYDWARAALRAYGVEKEMVPAKMADFGLAARRPGYSAMSNAALCGQIGIKLPHWRDSMEKFIGENK
ncbi:MAG: dTDP-4-dehydrorhamnose reductase [Elusimicrobia bacterium]|nr:MAG: dTDP-4-dehydrorhamnose reductase [Elusimicrobiota bacterium]KAF0155553.1 MAG: dTDP-4-dehydrorhamnose reductase [Elusimicrobiota bacterium]